MVYNKVKEYIHGVDRGQTAERIKVMRVCRQKSVFYNVQDELLRHVWQDVRSVTARIRDNVCWQLERD